MVGASEIVARFHGECVCVCVCFFCLFCLGLRFWVGLGTADGAVLLRRHATGAVRTAKPHHGEVKKKFGCLGSGSKLTMLYGAFGD